MGSNAGISAFGVTGGGGGTAVTDVTGVEPIDVSTPEDPGTTRQIALDLALLISATSLGLTDELPLVRQPGTLDQQQLRVTTEKLIAGIGMADVTIRCTDNAAADLVLINAAITYALTTARKVVRVLGTLALGDTKPTAHVGVTFDFTGCTAIIKAGTWADTSGTGWFDSAAACIGSGVTPVQYASGTTGPVFGGSIRQLAGFEFDSTWDAKAASVNVIQLANGAKPSFVDVIGTGVASSSNRTSVVFSLPDHSTLNVRGTWFNATVSAVWCNTRLGAFWGSTNVSGHRSQTTINRSVGTCTHAGESANLLLLLASTTVTSSATYATVSVLFASASTVTLSGTSVTAQLGVVSAVVCSSLAATIVCNTVSTTVTMTGMQRGSFTVENLTASTNQTHVLATGVRCAFGITSTAKHTFSAANGCIVTITGTTDGPDVDIAGTSDNSNWTVNLTGTGAQLTVKAGADNNDVVVTSDTAPVLEGYATYTNRVRWNQRNATNVGHSRWVSVRKPNTVVQVIEKADIVALGHVLDATIDLDEQVPAAGRVIHAYIPNLGTEEAGPGTFNAEAGVVGNTTAFVDTGSIKLASECASTLGAGFFDHAAPLTVRVRFSGTTYMDEVAGFENGCLVFLEYA